ncbi:cobalt-precorrin 5A hydrolase [Desulfarculales bacterium]
MTRASAMVIVRAGADPEARHERPASTLAVYAITPTGAEVARTLAPSLSGATLFLPRSLAYLPDGEELFDRLALALAANFLEYGGHVILAAAGIVVRALAPLLHHKAQDPAVVVVDQAGRYAVSLLSGHLGGSNALARRVAEILGGQAVITTATDTANLPSLEMLAGELGFRVENLMALARAAWPSWRAPTRGARPRRLAMAHPGAALAGALRLGQPGASQGLAATAPDMGGLAPPGAPAFLAGAAPAGPGPGHGLQPRHRRRRDESPGTRCFARPRPVPGLPSMPGQRAVQKRRGWIIGTGGTPGSAAQFF